LVAGTGLAVIVLVGVLLASALGGKALLWTLLSALVFCYPLVLLWHNLPNNIHPETGFSFPSLGPANLVTMLRALLISFLGGLLVPGALDGHAAWLPAFWYTLSLVIDYFDGLLARVTGQKTKVGATLEHEIDSLGVLLVSGLLIRYGRLSAWFLLVGLARYLFLFGIWVRRRSKRVVVALQHSYTGRIVAGFQMGFMSAALWPIIPVPLLRAASLIFAVPFLGSFLRDWLAVCGLVSVVSPAYRSVNRWMGIVLFQWAPVLIRLFAALVFAAAVLSGRLSGPSAAAEPAAVAPAVAATVAAGLSVLLLLAGVAGRLFSLVLIALLTLGMPGFLFTAFFWMLFVLAHLILLLGTGKFSLWKPEELVFHRDRN
jgi:CDP-diacylglycerol--glycerol-3-phosphate 3-phosphatidyltransferase